MEAGILRKIGLAALCFMAPALALAYAFPYPDPFYATITTAILKADHLDRSLKYDDLAISPLPARDSVPFFGRSRNKVTTRLWMAPKNGPLLVMIAGLGGTAGSTYNNYLASQFVKRGFHVLAIPSPFYFSFALAASRSGYPGITRADAKDLYVVIEEAVKKARKKTGFDFNRVGLLGVSMGALEVAYLSELDSREQKLNFSPTLLINPPVDPIFSGGAIDALGAEGDQLSGGQRKELQEKVILFGSKALMMKDIKSPDYFTGIEELLPTSLAERKFLIGSSMKDFLHSLIFVTQQVDDLGVLKTPVAQKEATERLAECEQFGFQDYLNKFMLPGLSKAAGRNLSLAELQGDITISGVEAHLRSNPRIYLMHNEDDFIVNQEQLAYLRSVFGDRMALYPHGGHVGNIWYPENLEKILSVFSSLNP